MTVPDSGSSASHASRPIDHVIRSRRTAMFVDDSDVDLATVEELCELASWAPCHKKTWPWEFALITGAARERFGNALADVMEANGDEASRVAKTRTKYLRTPAVLIVSSAPGETPLRTAENRDATAAAIQNLLLAATARGLATFWSSCPRGTNETAVEFCDFTADSTIVGIVYLGRASRTLDAPPRPTPRLTTITT